MDCSTPGFPVHHQLTELAQTHFHRVGDTIQISHPLSSPSPPALNLSQHQGLLQWVSSLHQVAKVLEFQLQNQSFQWIQNCFLLEHLLLELRALFRKSQNLICVQITWGSSKNANCDSVGLGWGLSCCIANRFPYCWSPGHTLSSGRLTLWLGLGTKVHWSAFPVCTWRCKR